MKKSRLQINRSDYDIHIGIDPGVKTGVAVWDARAKRIIETYTVSAFAAEMLVQIHIKDKNAVLVIEDARLRRVFQGGSERYQGAGSIKRDCKRWEEFCTELHIPYILVAPNGAANKIAANIPVFQRLTGVEIYNGKKIIVSKHARDACMLVFQQ